MICAQWPYITLEPISKFYAASKLNLNFRLMVFLLLENMSDVPCLTKLLILDIFIIMKKINEKFKCLSPNAK